MSVFDYMRLEEFLKENFKGLDDMELRMVCNLIDGLNTNKFLDDRRQVEITDVVEVGMVDPEDDTLIETITPAVVEGNPYDILEKILNR